MSYHRWTTEEEQYLRDNYSSSSIEEISKALDFSRGSITNKAKKMGLMSSRSSWTPEQTNILMDMYSNSSAQKISEVVGHSIAAVKNKAKHLGLIVSRIRKKIISVIDDKTVVSICNRHGESIHSISKHGAKICKQCLSDKWDKRHKSPRKIGFAWERIKRVVENRGYKLLTNKSDVSRTTDKISIECPKGHISVVAGSWFLAGSSCRECSYLLRADNRRLDLLSVIDFIRSIGFEYISGEYKKNTSRLLVRCTEGHVITSDYMDLKNGSRCPVCKYKKLADSQRTDFSSILDKLDRYGFRLITDKNFVYENNRQIIPVVCPNGHIQNKPWHSYNEGCSCKQCSNSGISIGEKEVFDFVRGLLTDTEVLGNVRNIIKGKELDIYIPTKKIAIEYNGLYWHSVDMIGKGDYQKYLLCKEQGIRYIGIFEDEWLNRRSFIEQYLKRVVGVCSADKKLRPKDISIVRTYYKTVKGLLDEYHYNRSRRASFYYGLFFGGDLIGALLISKPSRQHIKADFEIVRMCLHPVYHVPGIWSYFSKIILDKEFYGSTIVSYSDNRRDTGNVYRHMGFHEDGQVPPDYYWCDGHSRIHKSSLRKTEKEILTGLTEEELRISQGYFKVYDVGKTRWIKMVS